MEDLYSFDLATKTCTLLSFKEGITSPSPRMGHGFTSAGGKLYLYGGTPTVGERGVEIGQWA
jgi:hypothetical protein